MFLESAGCDEGHDDDNNGSDDDEDNQNDDDYDDGDDDGGDDDDGGCRLSTGKSNASKPSVALLIKIV